MSHFAVAAVNIVNTSDRWKIGWALFIYCSFTKYGWRTCRNSVPKHVIFNFFLKLLILIQLQIQRKVTKNVSVPFAQIHTFCLRSSSPFLHGFFFFFVQKCMSFSEPTFPVTVLQFWTPAMRESQSLHSLCTFVSNVIRTKQIFLFLYFR